jgi:prepilin-type N-terminal cleavage/methylation domain-containing protein
MSPRVLHLASRRPRTRGARGFTLVELIIAMAAGLAVAAAAVLLSKNASRVFQNEVRFTSAHLAAVLGISRLSADLQRAAFLSSPNVSALAGKNVDPTLCGSAITWQNGARRLAGVTIIRNGSELAHGAAALGQSIANGFSPDALIIGGAFGTNEQFPVREIVGLNVYLQVYRDPVDPLRDARPGAMVRTLNRAAAGSQLTTLNDIFRTGRLLRLIAPGQGQYMYGVIDGVDAPGADTPNGPTDVIVRLKASPTLPVSDGKSCGLSGRCAGCFANPVARIRYDIRSLIGHPTYGPLVDPATASPNPATAVLSGDNGRTELVRVELDEENAEIGSTLELVSEYAVDLEFGISVASVVAPAQPEPVITRYPVDPNTTEIYTTGADIYDNGTPQRIRAVQVRLSTRTRAPDRIAHLAEPTTGDPLRFVIPGIVPSVDSPGDHQPLDAPPTYARLRTIYADIALPNQARADTW